MRPIVDDRIVNAVIQHIRMAARTISFNRFARGGVDRLVIAAGAARVMFDQCGLERVNHVQILGPIAARHVPFVQLGRGVERHRGKMASLAGPIRRSIARALPSAVGRGRSVRFGP